MNVVALTPRLLTVSASDKHLEVHLVCGCCRRAERGCGGGRHLPRTRGPAVVTQCCVLQLL